MPCPKCKGDNFVRFGDEFECMNCGFKWHRVVAKPIKERAEEVRAGGFPRFLLSAAYGLALYVAMGIGYSLLLTLTRIYITPPQTANGLADILSAILTTIIFTALLLSIIAVSPVIAAVTAVFIGMRHRGESLKAAASALIAATAGYLILIGLLFITFTAILPELSTPDQTTPTESQLNISGIIAYIIPQTIVGVLTALIISRAMKT